MQESNKSETSIVGPMVIVLIGLIGLAIWAASSGAPQAKPTSVERVRAERVARGPSMAQFIQVRDGMSVVEVENLFERVGTLSAEAGGTSIYTWTNDSGGVVSVTFQDRHVSAKAQAGLQ